MRNLVNFSFKWIAKVAKYICPNPWWAIPLSLLVVGLTTRVVASRLDDMLWGDNYWLMQGVEKPLLEYMKYPFGVPLLLHYWVSYRVFGGSLTGYLVLPLISSLATLLVIYFGIKKQWGDAAWGVCFLTLAFMVSNGYSLFLADYAMITYGTELLVSCGLFFLFIRLSSGTLTKRQRTWVALISIPAAFFSNIYILVLVFVGAVSVVAVRYWHSDGRYRLNDLRQHVMQMWPLAVFPVVQVSALLFHPLGAFAPIRFTRLAFSSTDAYFFRSSNYPETFWGAVQFVSHNTVALFRALLQTAPYKGSYSLTPSIFIVVVMLIVILVLAIRMLQRRLKPDMSFVVTFTILALSGMAVGALLGIYPYGLQRYSVCMLLPMGLIIAYAVHFVLTKIVGRFSAVLRLKAIPFVLALIIIVAGTVCNVDQLHYNTAIAASNQAALHQIAEVKADLVLITGFAVPAVGSVHPDFFASAHNMGYGLSGLVRGGSDTVPPEIVDIIEGIPNEYGAAHTPMLVIDYVAAGPTPTPTLTLYPVADATVVAQDPTTNYGTQAQVVVQAYKSSDRERGLFQFDLSSIPAGSTINSATFSAYYDSYYLGVNPVGRTYCLYRTTGPWTETEVNWNNQPGFAATEGTSTVMPESFGWVNWNVKDMVQTWVNGATNYGFVMMDSNETEGVNSLALFYSKEYAGPNPPPRLAIDYTTASLTPTPTHSLTLYCMAATTVVAQDPTSNYGTQAQVVVQAYKSSDRERGLFQFDLSSIPAGSTINSATFSAYYDSYYIAVNPVGRTYCLYRNTSPWTEREVNWNNQPSFAATEGTSTVMPESFGWVNWNVKDMVQTWVNGATNYGFVMMDSNETEGVNALAMFYANVNADTIFVINISGFNAYYPDWSALLATYFDCTSEIQGHSIWGGYYTRRN